MVGSGACDYSQQHMSQTFPRNDAVRPRGRRLATGGAATETHAALAVGMPCGIVVVHRGTWDLWNATG